jgi:membrane protease YdiL (CAAX protease family)
MMPWFPREAAPFVVILVAACAFPAYWFMSGSAFFERRIRRHFDIEFPHKPLAQKYLGAVVLGLVPAGVLWVVPGLSPAASGIGMPDWPATLLWGGFLALAALPVPYFSAQSEDMQAYYPQIRVSEWDLTLFVHNGWAWTMYLLAYEFLFRGVLVIGLSTFTSPWTAVALSGALATATHIPKGAKETFATVPYSLLLGFVALQSGSVWAGVVGHAALAISNDFWAVRHSDTMRFVPSDSRRRRIGAPLT